MSPAELALPLAVAAASLSSWLCWDMGGRVEREDTQAIAAGRMGRDELLRAIDEKTLSPAAATAARGEGLLTPEEHGRADAGYSLRCRRARWLPAEAGWLALALAGMAALALAGADACSMASAACACACAALDSRRRLASWRALAPMWALGAAAAGQGPAAAAGRLALALALCKLAGRLLRRVNGGAVGRGDDALLACVAAGCASPARLLALCAGAVCVLAAQAIWLRSRGRRGEPQPLACALVVPYMVAMAVPVFV